MNILEVRQQIHKLIDKANENQLNALLRILNLCFSRYTQEEINDFYNRVKLFEEGGSKGFSVIETHANIRSKYKEKYGA